MQQSFHSRTHQCAIFSFFKLVLFVCIPLFFLNGCFSYRMCPHHFTAEHETKEQIAIEHQALSHPLYRIIPRHREQIAWYDLPHFLTWMVFGNDNDGIFGESQRHPYQPNKKNTPIKALKWWIRNPFHNFTFYTIGRADQVNSELILLRTNRYGFEVLQYNHRAKYNFGGKDGSLLLALHGGLPFVSFRLPTPLRIEGYLGWRESGNFGICLRKGKKSTNRQTKIL